MALVTGAYISNLAPLGAPKEQLRVMRKHDPDRLAMLQRMATEIRNATETYAVTYRNQCLHNGVRIGPPGYTADCA